MIFWVVIVFRALKGRLRREHPGNMPWLFFYSALSIPLFYAAGLAFWKDVNFTVMDFWRFWVVHLWVEDFLELFTTIMVAYLFVLLGVVRMTVATRIVYLDIILYSIGGVIGTLHHLYFNGTSSMYMAFGAFFSAMEVIPLLLLTLEAWRFMRLGAPTDAARRQRPAGLDGGFSAQVGRHVPGGGGILELFRRRRLRLSDQPAYRQLL